MTKLRAEHKRAMAVAARYDARSRQIVVSLESGVELRFKPRDIEGRILAAVARDLAAIEILQAGSRIGWPRLGLEVSISDLLTGKARARRRRDIAETFGARFLLRKGSIPADIDLEF